ncbi:MAG: xylulokinase [Actinomycetota bacterium]
MPIVAGIDSSTQSCKVELRDADSGEVVGFGSAAHPAVTPPTSEQDPDAWWHAFEAAYSAACESGGVDPANGVAALSVGGQQHGMVALDARGRPVHPAKLWNDMESAADADWLIEQLGSADAWAEAVSSVPVAAFTVTKLSWLHRVHPDAWSALASVHLPHDELTRRLTGRRTTDRGDASGTGYWSPATGDYRWDILELIDAERNWRDVVPEVLGPLDVAGEWHSAVVAPGSGDNMAAALGVGLRPGDAVISIGTSGTVYAVSETPTADPSGAVAGFADATGRFLPLVCTSNAAKVLDAVRGLLGVDHRAFDRLALAADHGGPVMLPYFDGERTPNRPDATGEITGLRTDVSREQFARAAVDGVACGLLDGLDALQSLTPLDGRVLLVGGAARSEAVQRVIAGMTGRTTLLAEVDEAVATGAAVQAAAVLEQTDHTVIQDRWGLGAGAPIDGVDPGDVRTRYAAFRDR